jgi:hypothetical protein
MMVLDREEDRPLLLAVLEQATVRGVSSARTLVRLADAVAGASVVVPPPTAPAE